MFEKEAEEIANKRCHEIMCFEHCSFSSPKHHRCGEWHREYNCAKEGIEYAYNKAKEQSESIIKRLLINRPDIYSGTDVMTNQTKMFAFASAVNDAIEYLKESE